MTANIHAICARCCSKHFEYLHGPFSLLRCNFFLFYFIHLFICESKDREVFHLFIDTPNGYKNQDWAMLKSGAWNCIEVSKWVKNTSTWAVIKCFTRHISRKLNQKQNSQKSSKLYDRGCGYLKQSMA